MFFTGQQVPDELGYFSPLRAYEGEDVYLSLPGKLTVFDIRWFSIYDKVRKHVAGITTCPEKNDKVWPRVQFENHVFSGQ